MLLVFQLCYRIDLRDIPAQGLQLPQLVLHVLGVCLPALLTEIGHEAQADILNERGVLPDLGKHGAQLFRQAVLVLAGSPREHPLEVTLELGHHPCLRKERVQVTQPLQSQLGYLPRIEWSICISLMYYFHLNLIMNLNL